MVFFAPEASETSPSSLDLPRSDRLRGAAAREPTSFAASVAMVLRLHHSTGRANGRSCVNSRSATPITAITVSPLATVSQDPST